MSGTTMMLPAPAQAFVSTKDEGIRAWLEDYGSRFFSEQPGCVSVTSEDGGVFHLIVNSDDRLKADQLGMSLTTFLDISSQDFGERFLLRY